MTKEITINTEKIKRNISKSVDFLKQKKIVNILVIILFLITLFIGVQIRTQNLPNLIDITTGDYTPLALDPYYFLRVSETILQTNNALPEIDNMRYPSLSSGWTNEILPQSTVLIYKIINTFDSNTTLNYANVLNPVIFFILGLILFFFLCWKLSKNKWIALIASFILSIIPPYLYRTLAGFSDHEAIGIFGFFLALLLFSIGLLYLEKRKTTYFKSSIFGFISGIATMVAIASWGGGAKFLFMILPLSFLIIWLIKKEKSLVDYVLFYSLWVAGILLSASFFGYEIRAIMHGFFLNSAGILTLFVLFYSIITLLITKIKKIPKIINKNKNLASFLATIIFGLIAYQIFIGSALDLVINLFNRIIYPFGTSRVGLTVAENKQPYLNDWISQITGFIFYTFLAGCFIIGGKLAKGIKIKKYKFLFTGSFTFFIIGILFSRISSSSILNGDNFISKLVFLSSFLILFISSIYIYKKSEWEINSKWIIIASWMIPMLLAVRSAIRVFFAIVPFVAFLVPLTLFEIGKFARKMKDDFLKMISILILIALIIGTISTCFSFYSIIDTQSKYQAPSYNQNWQNAMSWVRENTPKESIFLHWWDYGYWVQTGGGRATITDGGHFNGYWDHLIGRYVLTTPYPETAKSFIKSHKVSHLLIDPSDIGKYPAYSSIGNDQNILDRSSFLATFISNPSEIRETAKGEIRIYNGGISTDTDIIYNYQGKELFLPAGNTILGAVIVHTEDEVLLQPIGIYVYNNQQYEIPLKYLFYNSELIDFGEGIESTAYIYPNLRESAQGQTIDFGGALIYLSEKVKDSLVVKLYLMGDPLEEYSEFELVHTQGILPNPFYYNGFNGPIKIWEIGEMENILIRNEFLETSGEFGSLDDLEFIK